ncbi:hypothetical protein HMI01_28250 [Halolactibacillus miurensis]|uniref:Uncharacterized protein n=1 Tax=Halolactibacillus miurensis TaxID=306541 RepID=A0A1I6V1K5_9BACI|nr:hypothetical protein HMI01_28250 [Halolactibacillus miurensis]SFT07582.1 hypothetical protein SAMN05421668_14014 [Halolactibacillus miurensis]
MSTLILFLSGLGFILSILTMYVLLISINWYVSTKLYNFFKERNSGYRFLVF